MPGIPGSCTYCERCIQHGASLPLSMARAQLEVAGLVHVGHASETFQKQTTYRDGRYLFVRDALSDYVVAPLATTAHPASTERWMLTERALEQIAAALPGKVVTWDYDPASPVGHVTGCQADGKGIMVEIAIAAPGMADDIGRSPVPLEVGPAFVVRGEDRSGVRRQIEDLDLLSVAIIPERTWSCPSDPASGLRKDRDTSAAPEGERGAEGGAHDA